VAAEGGEIFDGFERDELAREVADGGALEGEGHDRDAGGVGGGLAEQAVFRATADDEDALKFLAGHFFEGAHGIGVAAAEGVADEAGVGGEVFRRGEFPAFQLRVDRGLHRSRIGERGVGDVEQRGGRGEFFGGGDERGPSAVVGRARGEVLHRAFEQPQADDVGEGPVAAVADAFVGDTGGEGFGA
jgi:hypothetical protein